MSIPLKEGLRQSACVGVVVRAGVVEMSIPLKEGLRQVVILQQIKLNLSRNVYSIKRRIATVPNEAVEMIREVCRNVYSIKRRIATCV